jgi:hypothetical protein
MTKVFAIVLLIALFPTVVFGIVMALLVHPLFLLLLGALILAVPAIARLRQGD